MAQYRGETYNVPLEQGGFCHNKNIDTIAPVDMVHPSHNIYMNEGGIRKRPGTKHVDAASMGAVKIVGMHDFRLANGNQFIIRATSDGKLWKSATEELIAYKVGTPAFTGTGNNDFKADNSYDGDGSRNYKVQIDGNGGIEKSKLQSDDRGIIKSTTMAPNDKGSIESSELRAPGESYAVNDTFTVNGGTTLATGKVVTVDAGKVVTYEILTSGTGYSVKDAVATIATLGTGTGFSINILELYTGGSGYVVNETFTVNGGDTLATGKVLTVSAGKVVTYEILTGGLGYDIKDEAGRDIATTTTSGSGTGFAVHITGVLDVGGKDYEVDDEFTVDGGGSLATGKVLVVLAGAVVSYEILTGGKGYFVADSIGITATSGTGIGFGIDVEELHDTFKWSDDNGVTWEKEIVSITTEDQDLNRSLKITFDALLDHVIGDYWTIAIAPQVWTTNKDVCIVQSGDNIAMCNGADRPVFWGGSGSNLSNFKDVPADWKNSNYPKYFIMHGRGNSLRMWAITCPNNLEQLYVSLNNEFTNFHQDTVLLFNIATGGGAGVVGGMEFGNRLVLFGKTRSFIFDDSNIDTNNWGYSEAQWSGGVARQKLMIRTPNDIICMMEDGEIYSVAAAQTYGDYKAASLTRASYMHEWIKQYVSLSLVNSFHGIYDPVTKAILFFVVSEGSSTVDTALMYFTEREPAHAWTILNNRVYASGYDAYCSALIRVSAGNWRIYTGDYAGRVWKLGEANRNDNSNTFEAKYMLPTMTFDDERSSKRYDRINIVAIPEGSCDATIFWYIDGKYIDKKELNFVATSGEFLGSFILGTSVLGSKNILELSARIGRIGKRLQIELKNDTANEDFFISQYLIDFIPLGKKVK